MRSAYHNRMIAWSLLIVALLAGLAASIFNLHTKIWWFDEALHFFTPLSITLVLALYAYGTLLTGRRRHEVLLVLTIAVLGLGLGTLFELVEWIYDSVFTPGNFILGKWDTMIDLSLNLAGGVIAGIVGLIMLRRGRPPKLTSL